MATSRLVHHKRRRNGQSFLRSCLMKKFFACLLSALVLTVGAVFFTACGNDNDPDTIDVYLPDGTPGLALAEAITEGVDGIDEEIAYHIVSADEITGFVSNGSADLAIMPTNAAAKIYGNGAKISLMSTNVFGNLYVMGVGGADTLEELAGKEVLVTIGTTKAMFEYILSARGVTCKLTQVSDGKEILNQMKVAAEAGEECYGVMGEPQVTACKKQVTGAVEVVNFQQQWKDLQNSDDSYPQASLVVNTDFLQENRAAAETFANSLSTNAAWIANTDNIASFKAALQNKGYTSDTSSLISAPIDLTTIANCNLGFRKSSEIKDAVKEYVGILNGGQTLDDNFFYAFTA